MKSHLEIDAWLDTLEWTPETAKSCVVDLCAYLKDKDAAELVRLVPRISAGLECLADNPDELYRLADYVYQASQVGQRKILAVILASVNAALPEHHVQEAIRFGALVPILVNRSYTISQRLAWLKKHPSDVFVRGGVGVYQSALETPIKDALALWCFMEATGGGYDFFEWGSIRLPASEVATKKFLQMHAPNLVETIDIVMTLGLSYGEAVDMLIDAGDGKLKEAMLALPGLDDTQAPAVVAQ
jgi:hypothetical protein